MKILAIDPGPEESACVVISDEDDGSREGQRAAKDQNSTMMDTVRTYAESKQDVRLVVEMIACYGMPVGKEVFETVFWIGRFIQCWFENGSHHKSIPARIYRQDVKLHLCKSPRANDATIRAALIDRFGPGKERAIGKKKTPGPLYGVKGDVWAALALAVTFADKLKAGEVL